MKTPEEKEAGKQRRKARQRKQAQFKHCMEICRTLCSALGFLLNLWVVAHVYLKAV